MFLAFEDIEKKEKILRYFSINVYFFFSASFQQNMEQKDLCLL